jgi:hypothetical protein
MPSSKLSSVGFSATRTGSQAPPASISSLEQTLIEFWLILQYTAAQIQQQPRLLDSLGAPRFTLSEIETVIGQIRARKETPVEVGPVERTASLSTG